MTTPDPITTAAEIERLNLRLEQTEDRAHSAEEALFEVRKERDSLTSQLEQAERVIAPFAEFVDCLDEELPDDEEYNTELGLEGYHSLTCGNFRAASQWIKDRQAKGEGEAS